MTTSPIAPQPAGSDEIDLAQLGAALKRHSKLIGKVTGGTLLVTLIATLLQKPVWEGEFQIVLASNEGGGGKLAQLAAANPMLAGLAGLGGGGGKDSLETEVQILQSPSVLKPVFDFVRTSKRQAGENVDKLRYEDWLKSNLEIKLQKGTSVLNINYRDSDKPLILPVIDQISKAYQSYSAKSKKRSLQQSIDWASNQIEILKPKALESTRKRDTFALSNGINGGTSIPTIATDVLSKIPESLQGLKGLELSVSSQQTSSLSGQNAASGSPYGQLASINQQIIERQQIFTKNDPITRILIRKRDALRTYIATSAGGVLVSPLGIPRSQEQAQSILLRYQQLDKSATRQTATLETLENTLLSLELEKAKQIDPWELISTPTLLDRPVSPKKSRNMALGLLAGLVLGSGAALVVDRRSGKVFAIDELKATLPYPLLAELHQGVSQSNQQTLQLLAQGALEAPHSVALIPMGLSAAAAQPIATSLQSALREDNHSAEVLCSSDLLATRHCGIQILLTAPGAATRSELAALVQQLQLQGTRVAGWLLLQPSPQQAGDA